LFVKENIQKKINEISLKKLNKLFFSLLFTEILLFLPKNLNKVL